VVDDVEQDVRKDSQRDGDAHVRAMHGPSHQPRDRGEQSASEYRMRVGEEVQMDGVGSDARVLDAEVGENDPKQLDELHRYEKWP